MPTDLVVQRVLMRPLVSAAIVTALLCGAAAQSPAVAGTPSVANAPVQGFADGITMDQRLAQRYGTTPPAPTTAPAVTSAAVNPPAAPVANATRVPTEAELAAFEQELDAALAEEEAADPVVQVTKANARDEAAPTALMEDPPSPVETGLLVVSSLGLLAFAGLMLSLVVRQLRKDVTQRKRSYRRRVKRRPPTDVGGTPATAT